MRISDWSSDVCSSDLTDPTPGNPLCAAVTRDPTTGYILNAFVDDRNLALIKQQGIDIDFRYGFDLDFGPPESRLRSEEHTSELQSLMRISYAVFCLKKKQSSYV